jgi:hypothetical protein
MRATILQRRPVIVQGTRKRHLTPRLIETAEGKFASVG